MTVGIVSHFFPPDLGGIPRLHSYAVRDYPRFGVRPVVVTRQSDQPNEVHAQSEDDVHRVAGYGQVFEAARAALGGRRRGTRLFTSHEFGRQISAVSAKVVDLFRRHDVSLVNSHIYADLRIGVRVADELAVPHVHMAHSAYRSDEFVQEEAERLGTDSPIALQEEIKATLKSAPVDVYVVHTEYLRGKYVELGVDADRIVRVPPGVDLAVFRRDQRAADLIRNQFRIGDEVVITCPTLRKHGFDLLLHAFARLTKRLPKPARLVCCDIDRLPPEHATLARKLKVDGRIICSSIPAAAMAGLYSASHVVVLCSTEEGIGLPVLEARACGTPVVAHRFGPFLELVRDQEDGLLVDVGDVDGLADALESAATDPELRQSLVRQGLATIHRYPHTNLAPQYIKVFRTVLEQPIGKWDPTAIPH
ncbi:MAG: glycosyltransferase family 4 protein [Actinopolymorphaceae bacterium]